MGIFEFLIDFLTNTKITLKYKIVIPVSLITVFVFIDNYIGISSNYIYRNKIESINIIEQTKHEYVTDHLITNELNRIESDIINRKSIWAKLQDIYKNNEVSSSVNININHVKYIFPLDEERSMFWHVISSSYIFIAIFCIFLFISVAMLFIDKEGRIVGSLLAFLISVCLFGVICLWQFLLGLIPIVFGRAYINYILQFVVQLIFLYYIYCWFKKSIFTGKR